MNLKRTLIALVAAGGVGVVAFGGSAVTTGFTAKSHELITASGGSFDVQVTHGNITAINLFPNGPGVTRVVTITNDNPVDATASITFGAFNPVTNGSNHQPPDPSTLLFTATENPPNIVVPPGESAADLAGQTFSLGTIGHGQSITFTVTVSLSAAADDSWDGGSATMPYTVHLQQ
jgi:hypothetical protein